MSKGLKELNNLVNHINLLNHINGVEQQQEAFEPLVNKYKSIIEKELKRLEELEKAFKALSKDDEKAKKELSKEIEKNRALEIIRNIGILKPYETSGGQCWLETMCDAIKITKENYDLLKRWDYEKEIKRYYFKGTGGTMPLTKRLYFMPF